MKKAIKTASAIAVILALAVLGINIYVTASAGGRINGGLPNDADCIIVLGAGIRDDGTPSLMLRERLDCAAELYFDGVCGKILLSGDRSSDSYDEVNAMKVYAEQIGIPAEDIYLDFCGFSTYDTMWRAKNVFGIEKAIAVTQKYHLYRAVYNANVLGIDTYGADCQHTVYRGRILREIRETAARCKDFFACILKPEPEKCD